MKRKTADSPVLALALLIAIIGLASTLSNPTITGAAQTKTAPVTVPSVPCAITCEPTYAGMQPCLAESHQQESYGVPNVVACVNHCCRIIPQ